MSMIREAQETYTDNDGEILSEIVLALQGVGVDYWIIKSGQVNKTFKVTIRTPLNMRGQHLPLVEAMKTLPCIYSLGRKWFTLGNLKNQYNEYKFSFTLKNEYFNGVIDPSKGTGRFLKFCYDYNVSSLDEFRDLILPLLDNLSKYAHTADDDERPMLRQIKASVIRMFFKQDLWQYIFSQKSYSKDDLILFIYKDYGFHMRAAHAYFLKGVKLAEYPVIYEKQEHKREELNLDFIKFLPMLRDITQVTQFEAAEILPPVRTEWL